MAEMPVQSVLNEAALRRVDPYVHQVLDVAKYVAVYSFQNNNWHKTGVEGSLFLYARSAEPLFNILVLNRLNKNNLIEPVTTQMDIQLQEEFLLYKNSKGNIYGIWFFKKDDCPRITNLIQKVMSNPTKEVKPHVVAVDEPNIDIFKMLTKAQEAYTHTKEGQPIPPRKQSPLEMDGTPKSVADFFARAGVAPQASLPLESVIISRTKTSSESEKAPFIHQLMSNPVHSVEHIEKQQRAVTPLSAEPNKVLSNPLNQQTGFFQRPTDNGFPRPVQQQQQHPPPPPQPQPSKEVHQHVQRPPGLMTIIDNGKPTRTGYWPAADLSSSLIQPPPAALPGHFHSTPGIEDSLKNLKMENVKNGLSLKRVPSPPGLPHVAEDKKPDLMPPAMFTPREPFLPPPPEPLTRNQLAQALDYLLRHDPDFMTKLHEAYVKSLTEKIL